jgi:hypothetical protein
VGQRVRVDADKWGIVIGRSTKSNRMAAEALENAATASGRAENQVLFKKLWNSFDDAQRARILQNAQDTRALRQGIPGGSAPKFYQAHHVGPRELMKNRTIRDFFKRIGFNIEDGRFNGVMLPPDEALRQGGWKNAAVHFGSHPNYTARMERSVGRIMDQYQKRIAQAAGNQAKLQKAAADALTDVHDLLDATRQRLLQGVEVLD